MKEGFIHRKNCRICQSADLVKILDLGRLPLANAFLRKEDLNKPEPKFPLAVYFCRDCGLLQLLDVVSPEMLFGHYYYLTSTSLPLAEHFQKLGKNLVDRFVESKNDLVIDIGGNDAVLLDSIKNRCRVLNIEPAKNVAEISQAKGVDTIDDYFGVELAEKVLKKWGQAKVVVASNVFAHIDDLADVINGVKMLIGDKGIFIVEAHWVANLLGLAGNGGFDQIYHEHLSYFSLSAFKKLFSRFGLEVFDVKLISTHGQSLQVYVGQNHDISKSVGEFLEKEKKLNLDKAQTYLDFAKNVERNKKELCDLLLKLKRENKKIVGYGAPAKGNILLNYCKISNKILDFIVDDSLLKQGLCAPGTHIPIYSPEKLKEDQPDYLLLLAWNYADSILEKEKSLRDGGVKFIMPVPRARII